LGEIQQYYFSLVHAFFQVHGAFSVCQTIKCHMIQQALYSCIDGLFGHSILRPAECLLEEKGVIGIGTSQSFQQQILISRIIHEPL
jgi:hypothetical protein